MTTTLTSLTGKVHHAPHWVDGTLCNVAGAGRGQVTWYWRRGQVTCKACLKVIAKAWDEAHAEQAARPTPVVPQPGPTRLPMQEVRAYRNRVAATDQPTIARDLDQGDVDADGRRSPQATTRTRKPQINHKLCSHAATPYARRQCRNHAATLPSLATLVDQAYQGTVDANLATPYNHSEYERCERVLKAALVVFANGDMDYANALRNLLLDSGEEIMYYVNTYSREENLEYVDRYTSF